MLQLTKEQLASYSEKNIKDLWERAIPELNYRKRLHERAFRKRDVFQVLGDGESRATGEKRVVVPFEYEILGIGQGYLGGKEPIYTVMTEDQDTEADQQKAKEYKRVIDGICRYNDCQATHLDLVGSFLETTAAYLYIYENQENQIVHAELDPLQTCGIFDYQTPLNLIGVIRGWTQKDNSGEARLVLELITDSKRIRYMESEQSDFAVVDEEQLNWGDVPVVVFEKPGIMSIFEPAIPLIDAYEQIVNNIGSMTQYNDNAKLKVSGYHAEHNYGISPEEDRMRREEEKAFFEALVLFVENDGDIAWLLKSIDYSGLLNVMKTLQTLIMFCVASPDTTDTTFTASESSLALRLKMFPFELRAAQTRALFKKGYLRQIEIETNRLNLKGAKFDFTRVDVEIPVNVPSDTEKTVAMAASMFGSGLFSQKTCIKASGVDVDPDQEMRQQQLEKDEEYSRIAAQDGDPYTRGDIAEKKDGI